MIKILKTAKKPDWVDMKKRKYMKYDFRRMQVGEVMIIPVDEMGCKDVKSFRALVWNRARQLGYELTCRQRKDGAYEVYRGK